jgi:hypothetical protein
MTTAAPGIAASTFLAWAALLAAAVSAAEPAARGGPYRVIAADFTGDDVVDLAVGYHGIGVVTIEAGDGRGQFTRAALLAGTVPSPSVMRGVYNLAHGDIDGDGSPDLVFSVHGTPPDGWTTMGLAPEVLQASWRGRVVMAKNEGQGRLRQIAAFETDSMATGVRLADLDRDGRLDLLYASRGSEYQGDQPLGALLIRQGLGDWEFGPAHEFEAGPSAYYVETADLNHDGFLDVIVPNEHGATAQYWLNPGKPLFERPRQFARRTIEATQIPGRRSHAINDVRAADVTGDGKIDLVTANLGTSTISLFPGNGDGTFQRDTLLEAGQNGAFLALGDLNQDGAWDVVITHWTEDFLSVLLNDGKGGFAPRADYKTGSGNYGATLADLNSDGKLDAVTANYRERSLSVLIGVGDGTFRPAMTTPKGLIERDVMWVDETTVR